jgi:hypothetical protein
VIFSGSFSIAETSEATSPPLTACSILVILSLRISLFRRRRFQLDGVRPTLRVRGSPKFPHLPEFSPGHRSTSSISDQREQPRAISRKGWRWAHSMKAGVCNGTADWLGSARNLMGFRGTGQSPSTPRQPLAEDAGNWFSEARFRA